MYVQSCIHGVMVNNWFSWSWLEIYRKIITVKNKSYISRFLILLLVLVSPITSSPAVPIYCRRFKANCSVRRDNICCRKENIAATATEGNIVVEKPEDITESEDNLLASSSIIEEVVVAPDEPPVSLKLVRFLSQNFPISGPEQFAASFYNNSQARQPSTKVLQVAKV